MSAEGRQDPMVARAPMVSRRVVARTAAWSLPVAVLAAAAPAVSASPVLSWHLDYQALTPSYGADTQGGFAITNTVAPPVGMVSDPVSALTSLLLYTNTGYDSFEDATSALDAAMADFTARVPHQGPSDPAGVEAYDDWGLTTGEVFDNGDGTFSGAAVYQSSVTILTGIGAVQTVTTHLTVPVLSNDWLIQAVVSPNSAVEPGGAPSDDVFLFDQADGSASVRTLARGAAGTARHRGPSLKVAAWFRAHR